MQQEVRLTRDAKLPFYVTLRASWCKHLLKRILPHTKRIARGPLFMPPTHRDASMDDSIKFVASCQGRLWLENPSLRQGHFLSLRQLLESTLVTCKILTVTEISFLRTCVGETRTSFASYINRTKGQGVLLAAMTESCNSLVIGCEFLDDSSPYTPKQNNVKHCFKWSTDVSEYITVISCAALSLMSSNASNDI